MCVCVCVCVCVSVGVKDVLLVSSTRGDNRLRCEDMPEDISLLLRAERPCADQRESLARDLSVGHIAHNAISKDTEVQNEIKK